MTRPAATGPRSALARRVRAALTHGRRSPFAADLSWAPWLAALAGVSGVYAIWDSDFLTGSAICVYVGESHTGRLRETLQRHWQHWTGPTAGVGLPRALSLQVAWRETTAAAAPQEQYLAIRDLHPSLNSLEHEDTDAPF